jgi:hypothetical protein
MSFIFSDEQVSTLITLRDEAEAGARSWASVYDKIYSDITDVLTDPIDGIISVT